MTGLTKAIAPMNKPQTNKNNRIKKNRLHFMV